LTVDTSISNSVTLRGCAGKRISWGDGHHEEGAGASTTHTYGETGEYQVVIHDIGAIPDSFIQNQTNVTSATLPPSITHVGIFAFANCQNLEMEVNFPNLDTLGYNAFTGCGKITRVVSLGQITSISFNSATGSIGMFEGCASLVEVNLPATLVSIDRNAFRYCAALTTVTLYAATPPSLNNTNAFQSNAANRKFYVPSGCLSAYQSAAGWSLYAESMIEF
jgi:hypothetical protein